MNLRALHRTSAVVVAAFTAVHLLNHLISLAGVPSHIAFMKVARTVYRQPLIELVLLSCVALQICSGLWLVIGGWRKRQGLVAWLQAASGSILAFFLLIHVGSVLFGRAILNLETNFYYAAAGLHVPPNQFFFGPYYFLAVLVLFTHLGCAIYWRQSSARWPIRALAVALPIIIGSVISLLIVLSLAGKLQPVEIPAKYKATYARPGYLH